MMFSLWGEQSTPAIQGLHTCWGVGFAIGPLILRPYLGPDRNATSTVLTGSNAAIVSSSLLTVSNATRESRITLISQQTVYNLTMDNLMNGQSRVVSNYTHLAESLQESHIEIPYMIISIIVFVAAICAFISYCIKIPEEVKFHLKPAESIKQMFKCSEDDGKRPSMSTISLLTFFCMYYFWNCGKEATFNTWLFKYAVDSDLDISKKEAALLDSAAQFSFLGGRILATLVAMKVPVQPALFTEVSPGWGYWLLYWS